MRKIHTAPLEVLGAKANGSFATEPYEAGWATEAIAMIYVREAQGPSPHLEVRPQISVDGVRWIELGQEKFPTIAGPGGYALRLAGFGNWLRLVGEVSGGPASEPAFILDIYWVLK